jgi:hypothetical protein
MRTGLHQQHERAELQIFNVLYTALVPHKLTRDHSAVHT